MKKGFVPIIIAAIIAGSVLVIGGGTTGYAYYHSNKLIESAKSKAASDRFVEAQDDYQKAAKWWPSKYRQELVETAKENLVARENYHKAVIAAESGDYALCIAELEGIGNNYPRYQDVESVLSQCRDNYNRLDQGQAAVALTAENQAAARASNSTGSTAGSARQSAKKPAEAASQSADQNQPAATNSSSSQPTESTTQASDSSSATNTGSTPSSNTQPDPVVATVPTTPPDPVVETPTQTIFGHFSEGSVESIVDSLQLVYDDATDDWITPPGGAPPSGVYHYDPVDVDNLYMGVHDGRLYMKITVGGTFPTSVQTIDGDTIASVAFNINIGPEGDIARDCGDGSHFQGSLSYHDGQIWYGTFSNSNCLSGTDEHNMTFEAKGSGTIHTYNSGIGKSTLVMSFPLSGLASTVEVGDYLEVSIASEAESATWHHYSYDQDITAWNEPVVRYWTVAEI